MDFKYEPTFSHKRVITYGTFDLLHYGHINLLRRAKELGNYLVVGLANDAFNRSEKGKVPYFDYTKRRHLLESIRYVDLVIEEKSWQQKIEDIQLYKIDIFVIGDDWRGKFDYLTDYCELVYLPRTPEISTSKIKNDLAQTLQALRGGGAELTLILHFLPHRGIADLDSIGHKTQEEVRCA